MLPKLAAAAMAWLFDSRLGKLAAGAAALAMLIAGFAWDQRTRGRTNAVAEINRSAEGIARKMGDARKSADRPGAVDRLRQHSCRDC